MSPLMVSQILLWTVVIVQGVVILALARQVGVLHERVAPAGALIHGSGPGVGEQSPKLEVHAMGGGSARVRANGRPAVIEQPTNIIIRSLNERDQDDRVRITLGLTGDDPLPEVDEDTLRAYHHHLAAHLAFPFEAKWEPEYGPAQILIIEEDAFAAAGTRPPTSPRPPNEAP